MVSQYDIIHNLSSKQLQKLKSDFKSFKLQNNFPKMTFCQFYDGLLNQFKHAYKGCVTWKKILEGTEFRK